MNDQGDAFDIQEIWRKAQKHKKASVIGHPLDSRQYQFCQCCDKIIEKQPLSICEHIKDFQTHGFGYPLWFSFLKYCIILMLVLIASKTANYIYMATQQNYEFCYGNSDTHQGQGTKTQNQNLNGKNHVQQPENHKSIESNNLNENSQSNYNHLIHTPIQIHPSQKAIEGESSSLSEQSSQVKCTSFMIFLSIFKGEKMYDNYFLKTIQFLIHLVALICIRNMILKQQQHYDQRTTLISNYSIMVHNLPNVSGIRRKLQTLFEQEFGMTHGGYDDSVKDFIFVFKGQNLSRLCQQKEAMQQQVIKRRMEQECETQTDLQGKISCLGQALNQQIQQARKQMDKDIIKCNKMIVLMATEGDKASVLYSFKQAMKEGKDFSGYFYDPEQLSDQIPHKKTTILLKEAPQPNEIIWEHIDEPDYQRKLLIVRGYLFTFLFLAAITVVFYFLMLAKTNLFLKALRMEQNDPNNANVENFKLFATFIVFIALFGVVLFNKFVMGNIIHYFVHLQHHAYTDKQNHSFALKYALGMFFTTALMTLAVEAVTYKNFYNHKYGVIQQETIMFFVTAFIIPLIWWIHPYNMVKKCKRQRNKGKMISQKEANELVQDFPYVLGKRYAQIFQIMWFTFLYSELIPLGSFLMFIGLILYYWVDKYNFLRRSAVKTRVSGKMAILGLKSLDATLFLSPAGQLLFAFLIRGDFDYPVLIFTVIGIIYLFLPMTSLIWEINGQKFTIQQKTYQQSKRKFKQTYHSLHPIYKYTHQKEIQRHRQVVKQFYREDLKKVRLFGTGRGTYRRGFRVQRKTVPLQSQDQRF